jgi:hypothetical protein
VLLYGIISPIKSNKTIPKQDLELCSQTHFPR